MIAVLQLWQVMKETLRIHPPLVGVMREAPPGYSLSGYDIPHNTAVMVSIIIILLLIFLFLTADVKLSGMSTGTKLYRSTNFQS